jgi:hypothetical protein
LTHSPFGWRTYPESKISSFSQIYKTCVITSARGFIPLFPLFSINYIQQRKRQDKTRGWIPLLCRQPNPVLYTSLFLFLYSNYSEKVSSLPQSR